MKSRTSLFNRTIILNLWQRYWVLFAGYGFVMGLLVLSTLINGFQATGKIYRLPDYISVWYLLSNTLGSSLIINALAAPLFAALLFSFLYNARHTGLMGSLPVKRETIYCSVCAAAVGGMLAVNVIVVILALGVELLFGGVHLGALAAYLGVNALGILAFFGMAALCCMLTGNVFAGPVVYGIFNFLAVLVKSLITLLLREIVFGYQYEGNLIFRWLSPGFALMEEFHFNGEYVKDLVTNESIGFTWSISGLGVLVIYALVGVVLLAIGLKLYVSRRMETAGDTIAIEKLKPVFRFCMTVGGGLVFACGILALFYDIVFSPAGDAIFIGVLLIIGGVLGYFIGKMLVSRTVRVFDSGWKVVGIYAVAAALLVTAVELNLFGYETHVPAVKDIQNVAVQVYDGNGAVILEEPENIADIVKLHENIIANKAFHELDNMSVPETEPAGYFRKETVTFSYELTDGSVVSRMYEIGYGPTEIRNSESEIRLLERVMGTREAVFARNRIGEITEDVEIYGASLNWIDMDTNEWMDYQLSGEEIHRLYFDCVLPDIMDGDMGQYSLIYDEEWAKRTSTLQVSLDIPMAKDSNGHPTGYVYFNFNVDTSAVRTMEFMEGYGVNAHTKYSHAIADGYRYNDLGQYEVDENGDWIPPEDYDPVGSVGIIGGADGPVVKIAGA